MSKHRMHYKIHLHTAYLVSGERWHIELGRHATSFPGYSLFPDPGNEVAWQTALLKYLTYKDFQLFILFIATGSCMLRLRRCRRVVVIPFIFAPIFTNYTQCTAEFKSLSYKIISKIHNRKFKLHVHTSNDKRRAKKNFTL
jgi:hypothetical protein